MNILCANRPTLVFTVDYKMRWVLIYFNQSRNNMLFSRVSVTRTFFCDSHILRSLMLFPKWILNISIPFSPSSCVASDYRLFMISTLCSRYSDWLRSGRTKGRCSSPSKEKYFSQRRPDRFRDQPASYPSSPGALWQRVKRTKREADNTSNYFRGKEYLNLYIYSPINLHSVQFN
jgi:hypothetical protein